MPKVLVVVSSDRDGTTASLAQSIAIGAARVRFTEVELVATTQSATANKIRVLGRDEQVHDNDGIVIVTSSPPDQEIDRVLHAVAHGRAEGISRDTVFAIAGPNAAALLPRVAALGGLIVTLAPSPADTSAHAEALGERVAKVVEWVRHALSHEHSHTHTPSHHHH